VQEHNIALADISTRFKAAAIADRYLDWLRALARPQHVLIDVKLNAWSVLSPWWQRPYAQPFFLAHLKQNRAVFIFIWRENLGDQLLSKLIAGELGIWHNLTVEKVAGRTLKAPIGDLQKLAEWTTRAEIGMLKHLKSYPHKVIARYEDLFENGALSRQFRKSFRQIAGIALPNEVIVGVRRNTVSKRAILENYDEVMTALAPLAEARRREWESNNREHPSRQS
jgi:hypothetical protein